MRYEHLDSNNSKKNEYNAINNNNTIYLNNNKSNSYSINNSNNVNITEKTSNIKSENKSNKVSNKNIFNSNINNHPNTYESPSSPESTNIPLMDKNDYNSHINNLKAKLSKTRAERRKKEEEAVTIQHRLTLLKNKEQAKILQFKNMKGHINKILNNRNKVQENLKIKLEERNNFKNRLDNKFGKNNYFSESKRNIKNKNYTNKPKKNKNNVTSSQNNIHPLKLDNFDLEKKNDKIDINIGNFNMDDDKININNNNDYNIKDSIRAFKDKLIKKIKQDEEEKKRIEKEIAKIEEEENKLLKIFNKKL